MKSNFMVGFQPGDRLIVGAKLVKEIMYKKMTCHGTSKQVGR